MLFKPFTCECGTHDLLQPFFVGFSNWRRCSNVSGRAKADLVHSDAPGIATSEDRRHESHRYDRLNAFEVHRVQFTRLDLLLRAAPFHFRDYSTVPWVPTDYVAELVCEEALQRKTAIGPMVTDDDDASSDA